MSLFRPEKRETRPFNDIAQRHGRLPAPLVHQYDAALTHSAVFECVELIADTVAGFPVHRYRNVEGARIRSTGPSMLDSPSQEDDPLNWRRMILVAWLTKGFAAGLVTGISDALPTGIELIDQARVTVERDRPDAPWSWKLDGKPIGRYPDGPLWIAPGKKLHPGDPLGRSVLEFAAAEISMGLASRRFGADFFASGGHPTGLVIGDGEVNEDLSKRVKARFLAAVGSREPVVMGGGWKYEQVQIAPNESQFLETIKANRTMVAGFFKVPPSRIGAPSGDGMTYKSSAQDDLTLLKFCMGPWVDRMETVLNPLTPPGEYVKLNPDSLLKVDASARALIEDRYVRMGKNSINEIRALEDEAPIEGGDEYLWPPYRAFPVESDDVDAAATPDPEPRSMRLLRDETGALIGAEYA